ncbi:NAD(P)/FAD-dependent oxidoreductase [Rhizobium leguminosarum]|uniref:NAD(P)/FAD-dependent oxidoreductase n=1 Tax=Rhizobium leguminosarum TaxID=384 RepID=UPI0014415CE9|nr:FAD-binding oxidoreductase [Rhizobium leguminosarum]NKL59572.1 FAD-dependent oxidoreductase [Rhizobium leguminosarum bv. viciae]
MPGPRVNPFHGDEVLPKKVDVVIIGGGIVGVSTALELAEQGLKVAVCEKGGIGHEQSSRNWGWVRLSRRDPREIPLMIEAVRMWETLDTRLGRDTGYKKASITFACATEKQFNTYAEWNKYLEPYQIESRMLSGREFSEMFPGLRTKPYGALHTPGDGRAEPQIAAPAIAEAAREKGAAILTDCAVRGLETTAGRVSGVVTERGLIECDAVVVAGGVWSNLFCQRYGIDVPQLNVMNSVLMTTPLDGGPDGALWTRDFALRKRQDGGYTIASGHQNIVDIVPNSFKYGWSFLPSFREEWRSLRFRLGGRFFEELRLAKHWRMDEASPFEYHRVLDPVPSKKYADGTLEKLSEAWPVFAQARIAQRWGGYIDVLPDAIPIISAVPSIPGFHIATGFSGHGFGIAPAAGRLMADIVSGRSPIVDPAHFRFSRFSDGSKIELMPDMRQ